MTADRRRDRIAGRASTAPGVAAPQVALRRVADRPPVTSVILGVRTLDQLRDNPGTADSLADDQGQRLDDASTPPTSTTHYGAPGRDDRRA
ncbi:MAG TPA: hypothetical protein VFZ70_03465 [Euzebyales bacterium]